MRNQRVHSEKKGYRRTSRILSEGVCTQVFPESLYLKAAIAVVSNSWLAVNSAGTSRARRANAARMYPETGRLYPQARRST